MPRVERWTRDGDHIEPESMSEEEARRVEVEAFDESSNIARTRVLPD